MIEQIAAALFIGGVVLLWWTWGEDAVWRLITWPFRIAWRALKRVVRRERVMSAEDQELQRLQDQLRQ